MIVFVSTVLLMAAVYMFAGLLFAVLFMSKGIEKTDPAAHGSGWGFRLIILPGTIILWPVLLHKWVKAKKMQHDQSAA